MKFLWSIICLVALVFVFESCTPEDEVTLPKATALYFSDYSGKKLGVIDLNNINTFSTIADASDGLDTIAGIAIDFAGGKIYAAEEMNNRIVRFNLDGSGELDVVYEMQGDDSLVVEPTALALDIENEDVFWANSGTGQIRKGRMDGARNVYVMHDSLEVLTYCYGMIFDAESDQLFFTDFGRYAAIYSSDIDVEHDRRPSPIIGISFALQNPSQLYFDKRTQNMYWADETLGTLAVSNGNAVQAIYDDEDGIDRPAGIAVDTGSKKIYWTEPANKVIKRANLDGTGEIETVLTGVESYSIILKFDNQ